MSRALRFRKNSPQPSTARRAAVKRRPQSQFRPRLELLEDRLAPAAHVWSGAFSSLWSDVRNWSIGGSPYGDNNAVLVFPESNVARFTSTHDIPVTVNITGIRLSH